ncbi:MAG: DUF2267 domain-containing protein [Cyclobacteriaceae bacterium]
MSLKFKEYALEAQQFVEELAEALGHPQNTDKTLRVLKAVLHTIRDRIIIQESFQFMAQLPTFLKALYVDNWKYQDKPLKFKTKAGLREALIDSEHLLDPDDFVNEELAIFIFRTVVAKLRKYISDGELQDVISEFPAELKDIMHPIKS